MQTIIVITGLLSALAVYTSGLQTYNSSNSVCCNGEVFTGEDSDKGYLSCCYQEDGTSVAFNYRTHTCCTGGAVIKNPGHAHYYGCCNGELFRYETHTCCNDVLHELSGDSNEGCCGDQLYNYNEDLCCAAYDKNTEEYVYQLHKGQINDGQCCGKELYNPQENVCQGEEVQPLPEGSSNGTYLSDCNGEWYDTNQQFCCLDWEKADDKWEVKDHKVYDMEGNRTSCCGLEAYDYTEEVCCSTDDGDTIVPKPAGARSDYYMYCCGGEVITDDETQLCHNDKIVSRENRNFWMCGEELYDSSVKSCCNDRATYSYDANEMCCWSAGEVYNAETQLCCSSGVIEKSDEDITQGNDSCCEVEERVASSEEPEAGSQEAEAPAEE